MPPRRVITGRSQEPRRRYAEELRLLRAERELSLRQLAETVGWDPSLFGKLESGATLGGPEVAQALDAFYGTPGLLLAMWEVAVADPMQFKERYRRYMELEAKAVCLWHYGADVIHGLLQTADYAKELLAAGGLDGDALDAQVEARMGRHAVLVNGTASKFRTILSESVLRTPLQEPGKWREQLEYLMVMAQRKNVAIQMVPLSVGLHGLTNTDTMFLRDADGHTVAWIETGYGGEFVQEASDVERLLLRYDQVRDLALTPYESGKFIGRMLEETHCESST
ncbi:MULTISPECIES: helix-turn-helix transcriptional regulator [unclassified Streptomyces]|uniref:helix-turn-helix domain-containing protein n=1 Tax=unclassified Streptomyces TaxID=2593676 RepID=UPI003404F9A1